MKKMIKSITSLFLVLCISITQGITTRAQGSQKYSANQLLQMSLVYYETNFDYRPQVAVVDHYKGDDVVIHLYDQMDTHWATSDWYTINRKTAIGHDILGNSVDLNKAVLYSAMNVYWDFTFGNNLKYMRETILDEFGYEMNRVTYNGIQTYSGILNYLRTIYSDEIIQNMLSSYRVNEDKIYRANADRGSDISVLDWDCSKILQVESDKYYNVVIKIDENYDEITDSLKYVVFKQTKVDNNWIFVDFPYFL